MSYISTEDLEFHLRNSFTLGKFPKVIDYIMDKIIPDIENPTTVIIKHYLYVQAAEDLEFKEIITYECRACHQCYPASAPKMNYCCNCDKRVNSYIDMGGWK